MPEFTIPATDVTLHVEDSGGEGRPVVLIHGWPMSAAAWAAQVPALVDAGYRVVAYDRRGFGRSSQPADGYDYDTLASDLNELMVEFDLTDAVLVGFSMGGGEVARYVRTYGESRLGGVVFASSIAPGLGVTAANPDGAMPQSAFDELADQCAGDRDGFLDGFLTAFFSSSASGLKVSAEDLAAARAIADQGSDIALPACIRIWSEDLQDDVRAITVPTLVVHGDGDQNVPLGVSGARMPSYVPQAKLVVIPDGPHGVNVSHADAFNRALVEWLEGL